MPQFKEIFAGMLEGASLPAFTRLVFGGSGIITAIQVCIVGCGW